MNEGENMDHANILNRLRNSVLWLRRDGFETSARNAKDAADQIEHDEDLLRRVLEFLEDLGDNYWGDRKSLVDELKERLK